MKMSLALLAFVLSVSSACNKAGKDNPVEAVNPSSETANNNMAEANANPNQVSPNPTTGTGNEQPGTCRIAVDCVQTLPELPAAVGFSSIKYKTLTTGLGANHRGRDVIATDGDPVILQAKFSYGYVDVDLKEEPVDIYLAQGCTVPWKKIATLKTSAEGENPAVEGVEDSGGRLYVDLAKHNIKLPIGRHRVLMVVPADNSTTELYVDVIPKTAKIVLTDIDGTLTSSEMAAAVEVANVHPETHDGAADMMRTFYHRGYNIFYLTARPEWLMPNTRDWLNIRGFPPGTIHTSPFKAGAQGEPAAVFKSEEMKFLKANTGIVPSYAFGNKPSDVKAFGNAGIDPKNSYYFKLGADAGGGTDHSSYRDLVSVAQKAPSACP